MILRETSIELRREAVSYGLDDLVSTINEAKAHMSSDEVPGGWVRLYTPRHKHHLMYEAEKSYPLLKLI